MVDAAPFHALRYDPRLTGDPVSTSAPAYSALERFAYAAHRAASPYTVLQLIVPDAGSLPGGSPEGRYARAGAAFARMRRTGVLVEEPRAAFFRYEEHELRHGAPAVQQGILAAVALDPPGIRRPAMPCILTHEEVEPERVAARLERLRAVPADLSPVFALYSGGSKDLRALLAEPPHSPPIAAFTDEAGVDHRVWRLDEDAEIEIVIEGLREVRVVIADGHHRYASAVAYRDALHSAGPSADPDPAWTRTLMYLVPVSGRTCGPDVRPIHRLVRSWRPGAGDQLARDFRIESVEGPLRPALEADAGTALGLRLANGVRLILRPRDEAALRARLPAGHSPIWQALDAAVLDYAVLPWLGAEQVEARSDAAAAAAEVEAGRAAALFLLRPTDARTVLAIAEHGELMPAKTTWFRPKPRVGLIMRALHPPERLPRTTRSPTVGM
jgi:uncharacterized protein (DUF1015 family)